MELLPGNAKRESQKVGILPRPTIVPNCPTRIAMTVMGRAALMRANWMGAGEGNWIFDAALVLMLLQKEIAVL